jgi:hypothetical protein
MRTALLLCAILHRTCTALSSRFAISKKELKILEEAGQHFFAIKQVSVLVATIMLQISPI